MLEEFANLSPVKKQENYKNPTFAVERNPSPYSLPLPPYSG
jgi:hypothetical protein